MAQPEGCAACSSASPLTTSWVRPESRAERRSRVRRVRAACRRSRRRARRACRRRGSSAPGAARRRPRLAHARSRGRPRRGSPARDLLDVDDDDLEGDPELLEDRPPLRRAAGEDQGHGGSRCASGVDREELRGGCRSRSDAVIRSVRGRTSSPARDGERRARLPGGGTWPRAARSTPNVRAGCSSERAPPGRAGSEMRGRDAVRPTHRASTRLLGRTPTRPERAGRSSRPVTVNAAARADHRADRRCR